jgi:tetratricopeptide (TPR) repeat protein
VPRLTLRILRSSVPAALLLALAAASPVRAESQSTSTRSLSSPPPLPRQTADAYAEVRQKMQTNRYAEAETLAQRYIQRNPRDPQMRYLLGLIQNATGRAAEAQETFAKLTTEYPELPEPHNALATLYAARGDYEQARLSLEKALRAKPDYTTALQNLGDLQLRLAERSYCDALKYDARNEALRTRLKSLGMSCPETPVPPPKKAN